MIGNFDGSFKRSKLMSFGRVGTGMNNVDLVAAKKFDISVYNTPLGPTQSVAEITVASFITLTRHPQANNDYINGKWKKFI